MNILGKITHHFQSSSSVPAYFWKYTETTTFKIVCEILFSDRKSFTLYAACIVIKSSADFMSCGLPNEKMERFIVAGLIMIIPSLEIQT
jgi:hypothetical protein